MTSGGSGGRPLRVCLVTDSAEPSGLGEHMLLLAESFSRADAVIAAFPDSGLPRAALARGLATKALDRRDPAATRNWLRRFDLVHVHAGIGWEGHGLARLARQAGVPTVLRTEHLPYLLTDPAQRREHADSLDEVDRLVCVSDTAAASFRAAGVDPERLAVIPNGVVPRPPSRARDAVRAALGVEASAPLLLAVGRLTPQKNHAALLAAMPRILAARPDCTLLVVGDGPLGRAIRAEIAARDLRGAVRMLGRRTDVPDLMAAADLLVLPSRFEGLPLVVLEAMAAGLPVVASRVEGIADAIEGGASGWLIPADDAGALGEAILAALADPAGREKVAAAARARFATHFTAARMAERTEGLYVEVAAESGGTSAGQRMERVRIGFVGAGGIAHRHFGVLEAFDDVAIVGVADVDGGRAQEAAGRFGARAFASVEAMLDAVELDALFICVPPFAHGVPEEAAIGRGLPFFVEKPISLDLDTAERIAAGVAAKNLVTAVGYHWRYLDTVDEARARLRENPAKLLSGYWLDSTPPPPWWWREDRSGGQTIEQTTHLLDLARFLCGEVVEVYGRAGHQERENYPGLDVPTVSTATLTFASGAVANFASTCLLGWNHRVGLHLFADRLAIELTDRDIMVDVGRGRPVRGADADPVWREDRAFVDAVKGGENRIRTPYAEALRTHRLAHAIVRSGREGEAVRLEASTAPTFEAPPLIAPPPRPGPGLAPGHRIIRSLGVERPGEPYIWSYEEGPPPEGHVRLDTLFTGLSAGTELTFLKNTNPYLHSRWDGGRGVFVPGEAGMHYPVPFLGYMEVARVAESRAPGLKPGDVVALTCGHKSGHTADPFREVLVPLPPELDPVLGIYVAQMGPIAANGILHADAELFGASVPRLGSSLAGRPALVIGGGVVGLLTALFAQRAGAGPVVVADPSPFRRERAIALGLLAMEEEDAWQFAKANWHNGGEDRGADFVFQTRADPGSLRTALKALRPQGTAIDLAFYQGGAEALRLGEEFHHNGLAIRCAQINRVPRGLGFAWDRRRLANETVSLLLERGEDIKRHALTHTVRFDDAPDFLRRLVAERPDFLQVVFDVAS